MKTIKQSMPLGEVARVGDYYSANRVLAMSGVWALFFAVVFPLAGLVLGIRAMKRGYKSNRAVFWLGIAATIVSLLLPVLVAVFAVRSEDKGSGLASVDLSSTKTFHSDISQLSGLYPDNFLLYEENESSISYATFYDKKLRLTDRVYTVRYSNNASLGGRSILEINTALSDPKHMSHIATISALENITGYAFSDLKETVFKNDLLSVTFSKMPLDNDVVSSEYISIAIVKTDGGYVVTSYLYPVTDAFLEPIIKRSSWYDLVSSNRDTSAIKYDRTIP